MQSDLHLLFCFCGFVLPGKMCKQFRAALEGHLFGGQRENMLVQH